MLRRLRNSLRNLQVSDRLAIVLAVCSGMVLAGLIVAWLTINTRTALLNDDLDRMSAKNNETTDEVNRMWTEIGEVTAQQSMEQRARQAGFHPPDKTEYLVTVTATVEITGSTVISKE
jgi:cell division protein FtsB